MKSYSDDIPTAEELKKNTRFTEDTNELVKTIGVSAMNNHEELAATTAALDQKLKAILAIGTGLIIMNLAGIVGAIYILLMR